MAETALAERLAGRTLELVDVASESGNEQEIAELVAAAVPLELAFREEETLLFRTPPLGRPLVLLAGHLDTVPAQENLPGRIVNGAVAGLGASDMKGGLAVMIELARALAAGDLGSELDFAFLFFPREELPATESALPAFFEECGVVRETDLAILLEPTDNTVQAGCLGHVTARWTFRGESAHSARPWTGRNAIGAAAEALVPLLALEPEPVEVKGLVFREVVTPTRISGGIADNVVPDRVDVTLDYRYAPHRAEGDAESRLRELAPGELEITGHSPAGRVSVSSPLVQRLLRAGGFSVEPKQAWTNVADFTSRGIDAVNLGPGATRYAHRRDERVEVAELVRTYEALEHFAGGRGSV